MSQIRSDAGNTGFAIKATLVLLILSALATATYDVFRIYEFLMAYRPDFAHASSVGKTLFLGQVYISNPTRLAVEAGKGAGGAAALIFAYFVFRAFRQNRAHRQEGGKAEAVGMRGPRI